MLSGLSSLQTSAAAIVVFVVVAVLSGALLPRWTVKTLIKALEEALKLKDKQLESKDKQIELLTETVDNYRKANDRLIESSTAMISVNEVATKALHALSVSAHQGEPDEIAQANAPSEG